MEKQTGYDTGEQEEKAKAFDDSLTPILIEIENTAVMIQSDRTEDIEPTFKFEVYAEAEEVSEEVRGEIEGVKEKIKQKALEHGGAVLQEKDTERKVSFLVRFEAPPVEE